jgi:hypothetical protein
MGERTRKGEPQRRQVRQVKIYPAGQTPDKGLYCELIPKG